MDKKQAAFLKAYAILGTVTAAALAAKVDRTTHYKWLKNDPTYPERFEDADVLARDAVEDEATERAMRGVYRPHIYRGGLCWHHIERVKCKLPDGREVFEDDLPEDREGLEIVSTRTVRVPDKTQLPLGHWERSDRLMELCLKGAKPAKYRDKAVEVTGPGGGPVQSTLTVLFV